MNINLTIINEFCSFIIFFYFSCYFILPNFVNVLNENNLFNFKNRIFLKFNKTLNNKFLSFLKKKEHNIKNNINYVINNNKFNLNLKKHDLLNLIKIEKKYIFNIIKNILKKNKLILIKNFMNELKKIFFKTFKNIYNELLQYNNEFIINYD